MVFRQARNRSPAVHPRAVPVRVGIVHTVIKNGVTLLTKGDLVDILAEGTGLTKVETSAVVDGLFATMSYAFKKGDSIDIRGFGRFKVVQRKARTARNPKSGEEVLVPARKVPVFRCSKELRDSINEPFEENDQFELKN